MEQMAIAEVVDVCPARDTQPETEAVAMHRMNRAQWAFWSRVFTSRSSAPAPGVITHVSQKPCFAEEIADARLFNAEGLFRRSVFYADAPRVAAIVRTGGEAVAHALLMPTCIGDCWSSPAPKQYGNRIGLLGVYVAEEHRGHGYARACIHAIAARIEPAIRTNPMCLVAEARVVRWCRPLFHVPVLARWNDDREPHERGYVRFRR
ncbi:GNAT family N-acetyltransferase [bacterium]|nr:MAG: GNAT family N-acetyltransferase [bacterium]